MRKGTPWLAVDSTLESPSGTHIGAAQGDLAVWTYALTGNPRIRRWAPDGKGRAHDRRLPCRRDLRAPGDATGIVGWMGVDTRVYFLGIVVAGVSVAPEPDAQRTSSAASGDEPAVWRAMYAALAAGTAIPHDAQDDTGTYDTGVALLTCGRITLAPFLCGRLRQ